jgi:hypothetical protein
MTESGRPPGWYPDPEEADTIRYWDGVGWSDRPLPAPGMASPPDGDVYTDAGNWVPGGSDLGSAEIPYVPSLGETLGIYGASALFLLVILAFVFLR